MFKPGTKVRLIGEILHVDADDYLPGDTATVLTPTPEIERMIGRPTDRVGRVCIKLDHPQGSSQSNPDGIWWVREDALVLFIPSPPAWHPKRRKLKLDA